MMVCDEDENDDDDDSKRCGGDDYLSWHQPNTIWVDLEYNVILMCAFVCIIFSNVRAWLFCFSQVSTVNVDSSQVSEWCVVHQDCQEQAKNDCRER